VRYLSHLLLAALCCTATGPAGARDFSPYLQASQKLQALPEPPRLKEAQGAALLAVLGDSARFLDGATFTQADMEPLMLVCGTSNKVGVTYMLHGLKQAVAGIDKQDMAAITRAVQATAVRNVLQYQDEVALVLPFTLRCLARQLPLIEEFLGALPPADLNDVRRGGARQMQQGVLTSYAGYFQTLSEKGISEPNLRRLSGAMAEVAPAFASGLQLTQRRQLYELAIATRARAPAFLADDLATIATAMANHRCGKLCGL
jgi:hypothetical protein